MLLEPTQAVDAKSRGRPRYLTPMRLVSLSLGDSRSLRHQRQRTHTLRKFLWTVQRQHEDEDPDHLVESLPK